MQIKPGLNERMGIVVSEATPERVVATMPVEGNTQPFGLLHGGASCVLAEIDRFVRRVPARGRGSSAGSRSGSRSRPPTTAV